MNQGRVSKYKECDTLQGEFWSCAVYLRISREDGDKTENDSIVTQNKIINNFIVKNEDIHVYDNYIDDGFTGTNFERPDFKRMIEDIKNGKVNCIIIKDLSRLGRNYYEMGKYIEVVFPLLKVRIISINDNIDSYKNPNSIKNIAIPFKVVMNDEYCRDISNKVRSALTSKRKRGQFIGSFAPYGYLKNPDDYHKLIIDNEAAENVKFIFKSFLSGQSILSISRMLSNLNILNPNEYKKNKGFNVKESTNKKFGNSWSDRTVRRILQNKVYIGTMVQKKMEVVSYKVKTCRSMSPDKQIDVENTHEAIIEKDTFEKVQLLLKRDTRISPKSRQLSLFAGYVKCADCKRAMVKRKIVQTYKTYYYYNCNTYRKMHKCSKHAIREEKLIEVVLKTLQKHISLAIDFDYIFKMLNNLPETTNYYTVIENKIKEKKFEKDKIIKILNELYPDMKAELITKEQYLMFKKKYDERITQLNNNIKELEEKLQVKYDLTNNNEFINKFIKYKNITKLSREIIIELINMIYIHENNEIEIVFNFQDEFENVLKFMDSNKKYVKLND